MKLDKDNKITEEQALHIANIMHRFWDVLAVDVVEDRVYMATNKLGVISITENGIYPLTNDTVLPAAPMFDYIKCPLNKWTFSIKPIREWVEKNCEGKTLNLFAGVTRLNIDEVRNDMGDHADAEYQKDALQFVKEWDGERFDTILLDPPYAYRKSMEMYNGIKASPFRQLKDELPRILKPNGLIITFGYHSNTMGKNRGFGVERIALFSHGGAIHDTIASVERHCR